LPKERLGTARASGEDSKRGPNMREDREVHQLRRRFVEGVLQNLSPGALRRYVISGVVRSEDRTGSGRNKRQR